MIENHISDKTCIRSKQHRSLASEKEKKRFDQNDHEIPA